jgi:hypothetical protein
MALDLGAERIEPRCDYRIRAPKVFFGVFDGLLKEIQQGIEAQIDRAEIVLLEAMKIIDLRCESLEFGL